MDIDFLKTELVGTTVPVPASGTLSGHAAGEPFDKHAYRFIKKHYPDTTFRQFEYLNKLYLDNPNAVTYQARQLLLQPKAVAYLLNRGSSATALWRPDNQFVEKQNDTADILIAADLLHIIDIKTYNSAIAGQPPNIISAYKLAKMCLYMIEEAIYDTHDITYVGITWRIEGSNLICSGVSIKELFKIHPRQLYINWAAAMQIQFHVHVIDQSYEGTIKDWCKEYLTHFVTNAQTRTERMRIKFIDPFSSILEQGS